MNLPPYNRHHEAFYRSVWESMPPLRRIRLDSRMIALMYLEPHADLHDNVAMVTPLSVPTAQRAYTLYEDYGDAHEPVQNLLNFMSSIEEAARHPKCTETERAIADLAVWQFEQQIPFIEDGWVDLSKYGTTEQSRVA